MTKQRLRKLRTEWHRAIKAEVRQCQKAVSDLDRHLNSALAIVFDLNDSVVLPREVYDATQRVFDATEKARGVISELGASPAGLRTIRAQQAFFKACKAYGVDPW